MEIVPRMTETIPDKNGIFIRTEYKMNENNKLVKVVSTLKKTIKKVIVNKNIETRKNEWKPFGLAATTNNKVTFLSDELVFMEPVNSFNKEEIKCKTCGKDDLTDECNIFKIVKNRFSEDSEDEKNKYERKNEKFERNKEKKDFKELENKEAQKIENIILIKNLSKNINEQDLQESCIILGIDTKNIFIINSRSENHNCGYITFYKKDDVEKYKKLMDNYGYDHLRFSIDIL